MGIILATVKSVNGQTFSVRFKTKGLLEGWVSKRLSQPGIESVTLFDEDTQESQTLYQEASVEETTCDLLSRLLDFLARNPHPKKAEISDILVGLYEVLEQLQTKKLMTGIGDQVVKKLQGEKS